MKKVCIVVSTLFTAKAFLLDQISALSRLYAVSVVANGDDEQLFAGSTVRLIQVPIRRNLALLQDLRTLFVLLSLFKREKFDAVHSITPKAGLLAMLAACAGRIPVRVHTFTGQVWATKTGALRWALKLLDRLVVAAATHTLVDSVSQRDVLQREGILAPGQGEVLGAGSISGVDPARFRPDATLRASVRAELRIPAEAVAFVFVGRLSRDKGVLDLARAFASLSSAQSAAYLLLVGPDEQAVSRDVTQALGHASERARFVGMTDMPERYLAAADIFCLPSYREGFGTVVIEAAAAGLPAIGSNIYGLSDAIVDRATGLLVPAKDEKSLAAAMERLASDGNFRTQLGNAARARALEEFSTARLTAALVGFYERVLLKRSL